MRNNTTKPQAAEATRGGIVTHKKRNVSSAIAMGTRLAMVSILEDVLLKRLLHADGFIRNRQHRVAQLQHKTHYMQIGHTGRSSDSLLPVSVALPSQEIVGGTITDKPGPGREFFVFSSRPRLISESRFYIILSPSCLT